MQLLRHLLLTLYQAYLFKLLEWRIDKKDTLDYSIQLLEYIAPESYERYTPEKGMDVFIQGKFKNAESCLTLLEKAIKRINAGGYLDKEFFQKNIDEEIINLDDFLLSAKGVGLEYGPVTGYYLSLLKELRDSLETVTDTERKNYYLRRIGFLLPSFISISEGLLKAVK